MKEENRVLITRYQDRLFFGIWQQGHPVELQLYEESQEGQLGDIYQAKVRDIVPAIHAAFVELTEKQMAYLPMEEAPDHGLGLTCGQEFPVQITKESQKTKDPVVSSHLSFPGRYCVLTTDSTAHHISSKIHEEAWRTAILSELAELPYGFILRTESRETETEIIRKELDQLWNTYQQILTLSATRKAHTRLWQSSPGWLNRLSTLTDGSYELVTDSQELLETCKKYVAERGLTERLSLRLYTDASYPLYKLYQVETELKAALSRQVWLKSGAYLVIDPTEAMTVIDVNTGKAASRKEKEEYLLKINEEAAKEAARQMRLRNLSGMILIDFIDMKKAESKEALIQTMKQAVFSDPVGVNVIDLTRLGIMECTRKKTTRPLSEQVRGLEL
jgi:ribonuclease G